MSDLIPQAADEEAWLYDSKDDSADANLPPGTGDDEDNAVRSQETNGDESQEEPLRLLDEPTAEKASESAAEENDGEIEEGEEEDDDDEDDIEITIGDTKAVPAAPASTFPAAPVNINIKKTIATTAVSSSAPGGQLIKAPHKGLDIDAVASINGTNIYEFNIDSLEEKPWRKPGADITDYFNYGFTEDTWKVYCDRQRRLRGDNNSTQGVKSLINQVVTSTPQYEKPYRPSFQPRSEPKEFRKSGTIDVIGGANSRRHEEALPPMMPPMNDMPFPPGLPPGFDPHGGMPPPHHGMPPPHAIPPPPPQFDPRFPPPTMDMAPPFDPYGGPPPHAVVGGDFHRPDDRPPMMPDDLDYSDRRRHHGSRDDREERDYREDRDRGHRSDRGERDDRRDRDREDRDSRRDRDKDRDRDRDHRDLGESRHRSSRKSRRHEDEEEDRRQKHKRSKRDDDN